MTPERNATQRLWDASADTARLAADMQLLRDRVDYLTVAVGRGDPRFCRPEHAKPDFDSAAFDAEWIARGRRVPDAQEVFG